MSDLSGQFSGLAAVGMRGSEAAPCRPGWQEAQAGTRGTNRSFLLLGLLLAPGPHRGQSPTQGHRRSTPARDSRGRMSVGRVQAEETGGPWVGGATYLGHITAQPDHKTVNKVWARSPAGLENRDPGLARDETGSLPQGAWAGRLALRPRAPPPVPCLGGVPPILSCREVGAQLDVGPSDEDIPSGKAEGSGHGLPSLCSQLAPAGPHRSQSLNVLA